MNWKTNFLLLILVLFSCKKKQENNNIPTTNNSIKNEYLIESEVLKSIISQKNIKILDLRKEELYNKEHILGAIHISRGDIEDTTFPYKGMLPKPEQIEKLFSSLGIESEDMIIAYDDKGLCETARLWWVLQNYNFKNIKMLHGGIDSWKSINGLVSNQITKITPSNFKLSKKENRQYYISKEEVLKSLEKNTILIDTRTLNEYTGLQQKKGAIKAGRIPKSIHIDWAEAINYNGNYHLKSIKELEDIYINKLNLKKKDSIILYCHSGVRSAHTTFILTQLLGFKNVKNYDGSWTEWSYFQTLPFINNNKK